MDNLILIAAVWLIACRNLFDRQLKNKEFSHSKRRCFLAVDRAKIGVLWGSQHLNIIRFGYILAIILYLAHPGLSLAETLDISDMPLSVSKGAPPLTLLVLGRDHKLYYEAYNDASDVNGDGTLDLKYNPSLTYPGSSQVMDYYGYFDSHKCYDYVSNAVGSLAGFIPRGTTDSNKTCTGSASSYWSGDFLNYLTTSRMDALRKVLYGGYRKQDTATETLLERTHIAQDAHSWGKEYTSPAVDGYNLSQYTPFNNPTAGKRHLFGNTSLRSDPQEQPKLRVILNSSRRIWDWASAGGPVIDERYDHGKTGPLLTIDNEYYVRVKVCDRNQGLEANCKKYGNNSYKPTGVLHQFGESRQMKFGLLSGSYRRNLSGGVLRKNIEDFNNEIRANTGQFRHDNGIVDTIDKLKITGFNSDYAYSVDCGYPFRQPINNNQCHSWGNPIAEMMYEGLRYFAGKGSPSSAFDYAASSSVDNNVLGLPKVDWTNPYSTNRYCAKPNLLVISDINPSFDSDQLPGSFFASFTGDLPDLNVANLGQTIWNNEPGLGGNKNVFIGVSRSTDNGAPNAKSVNSLGNIRGLIPDDTTKAGSYYSASIAYYGYTHDLNSSEKNDQKTLTYAIGLSPPAAQLSIPINGKTVTIIPFGKTVGSAAHCGPDFMMDPHQAYKPTNAIADFYIESLSATSGRVRVNFEDMEVGGDYDQDSIVVYEYQVIGGQIRVTTTVTATTACLIQHMGYIISGTTADGTYLVIRDKETPTADDLDYFLDTPAGQGPGGVWQDHVALPLTDTRNFTPSASSSALTLQSPLWYAAKWGGFDDLNNNNKPDLSSEWDKNNDGTPDNYFLITNPGQLIEQLTVALKNIIDRANTAASASMDSASLNRNTHLYQATFLSNDWSGHLYAYAIDGSGALQAAPLWDAAYGLTNRTPASRSIITYNPTLQEGSAFVWDRLTTAQQNNLNTSPSTGNSDSNGQKRLDYLRGSRTYEQSRGQTIKFRDRTLLLGDIVNSSPFYVGNQPMLNPSQHLAQRYDQFLNTIKNRLPVVYVGSNDGMLHAFDANTGQELLGFIPNAIFPQLNTLTNVDYNHKYFVDGPVNVNDAYFNSSWHTVLVGGLNKGGKAIYALDITDPTIFTENQANKIVLWEFTDEDLGFTYSQPSIVKLANGKWGAIFGNGYNSTGSGEAILYIVDIKNGSIIRKISTKAGVNPSTGQNHPNGLSTPAIISANLNGVATHVYAGDLQGNLWKFDISSSSASHWDVANKSGNTPKPIFIARHNNILQPITVRPAIGPRRNTVGEMLIYFGTGKYLGDSDLTDLSVQSFYAIADSPGNTGNAIIPKSNLTQQVITGEGSKHGFNLRFTSNNIGTASRKGWYIDLVHNNNKQGERVVFKPVLRDGKVIFTTVIPTDNPCENNGTSWLMEMNSQTGIRLLFPPMDLNVDGRFTDADMQNSEIPSGFKSQVGLITTPGIIHTSDGKEIKFTPGSSGTIQRLEENPQAQATGRQSWRQLR